ncbi:MAG: PilZ domain-containing protein [Hyphomicrobiales bacterium]
MAAPEPKTVREGKRVSKPSSLNLSGRYMNPDHEEFMCSLEAIELPDIRLVSDGDFEEGARIVVYLEALGRLEGDIKEKTDSGFVLNVDLSKPRLVKINDKLRALQSRDDDDGDEIRRHNRFEPANQTSHLTLSDGRTYPCEVVDISISGAAINVEVIPSIGTYVMLGKMRGRVTRILNEGIAIEFVRMLDKDALDQNLS